MTRAIYKILRPVVWFLAVAASVGLWYLIITAAACLTR
jgi:hypothetical protein